MVGEREKERREGERETEWGEIVEEREIARERGGIV